MVLWCDKEIVKYYRHLYYLYRYRSETLYKPAWDAHITVIRDEVPPEDRQILWRLHQGVSVDFYYSCDAETNGIYWWLPVFSDHLIELREELGLSQPQYPLHLSFGHENEKK